MDASKEMKVRRVLSLILEGGKKGESYQKVYGCADSSASQLCTKLLKDPEVQDLMETMQDEAKSRNTMSRVSKREYLRRLRDVKITEIDLEDPEKTNHDLIESINHRYDREGNVISTSIKLPSKLQALEMDNRMAGHNEPEKVEVELTGGVMMIPAGQSLEDFEKEAMGQQRKLKEDDYIDVNTQDIDTEEDDTLC